MKAYVVLLRGINVGGKNKVSMADLRQYIEELGFTQVSTYIASGNVLLKSDKKPGDIRRLIEELLPKKFSLDSTLIKALVLDVPQLENIVTKKPKGFGEQPDKYHSDAIFLMDNMSAAEIMSIFNPREGVDCVWPGDSVIYSQRLSAERTKSRLNVIVASPVYKSMTIRNWNTTTKLLQLVRNL